MRKRFYFIQTINGSKIANLVMNKQDYMALRNSATNVGHVRDYVKGNEDAKRKLVQFCYSCDPGNGGNLKGCQKPSAFVGMDIDLKRQEGEEHKDFEARLYDVRDKVMEKKDELGLVLLEYSISAMKQQNDKYGLHVVFNRRQELSQEENLKWASSVLGVDYDPGAKDITRVFFSANETAVIYIDDALFSGEEVDLGERNVMPAAETTTLIQGTGSETSLVNHPSGSESLTYLGIPYARIIKKWWDKHYCGQEPTEGDRNTKIFELAVNLRNICNFDENLMAQVIPNYAGFPEAEKRKTIHNAVMEKQTQMPRRLKDVLDDLKVELLQERNKESDNIVLALEKAQQDDELFHYNQIAKSVRNTMGIKDSIDAVGSDLTMAGLMTAATCIGARATNVQLKVHGKANTLNLITFVCGKFASGKGRIDDLQRAWMKPDYDDTLRYDQLMDEWREKYKACKNKKEQPVQPRYPKVCISANNTLANLAEEISHLDGKHAFTFTDEADVMSQKWKSSIGDFSTMVRKAYDASEYTRSAKSADAVNVNIPHLRWNLLMCGTPGALYRMVSNVEDGFQSRLAIASTPDNTYKPLDTTFTEMSDLQKEHILQITNLLPLLNGTVDMPKLEQKGQEWLEEVRLSAMRDGDDAMAEQRKRICVTAQRMTFALMLGAMLAGMIKEHGYNGAERRLKENPELWISLVGKEQKPAMLDMFDLLADSMLQNNMTYFRTRIEAEARTAANNMSSDRLANGRIRRGKNDDLFAKMPQQFDLNTAHQIAKGYYGYEISRAKVRSLIQNWERSGLVTNLNPGQGLWQKSEVTTTVA